MRPGEAAGLIAAIAVLLMVFLMGVAFGLLVRGF